MAINKHLSPDIGIGETAAPIHFVPPPRLPLGIGTKPAIGVSPPRPIISSPPPRTIPLPVPLPPTPAPPIQVIPPPPRPLPPPVPVPPVSVPAAPSDNPFRALPSPTAGSRIKSEDFRRLSQCLQIVFDACALSNALLGRSFGEAKQLLAGQHYALQRVMSVFGAEIAHPEDPALDERKVIQVVPSELGARSVSVIVTEAVETRRLTPNIVGLSYRDASERLRAVLGDVSFSSAPMSAPQLVGLPLSEARRILSR